MTRRHVSLGIFGFGAAALIVGAFFWPRIAAAGWLIAFVYGSAFPLGALVLLLIHRLTGGHWGHALQHFLEPLSTLVTILAALFVPIMIAMPEIFPWTGDSAQAAANFGTIYLSGPLFIVRAIIAFVVWSVLALTLPHVSSKSGQVLASLGLLFYVVITSFVATDWILSSGPPFISTSFGASFIVTQILSALALAALLGVAFDEQAVRDLAGLMLATVLGLTYIDFMAVLVIWYGDLPNKSGWFVVRDDSVWRAIAIVAFVLGSLLPVLALLFERVRKSRAALRVVAASILAGLMFYDAYLLAPPYGTPALASAIVALCVLAAALALTADFGLPLKPLEQRGTAHD